MDQSSLTYLLANPLAAGISALHPLYLGFLVLAPLFLLRRHRSGPWASWLRAASFLCLVAVLADVRLAARLPDDRLTVVAAVDVSESIDEEGAAWSHRYLEELRNALAPEDELAVLTFAKDALIIRPPSPSAEIPPLRSPPVRTATDISRALDTAVSLLGSETKRQILLLTDGNETRGDSRRLLAKLKGGGIRVDAAVPPRQTKPDVNVTKLIVPPLVGEGAIFPVRILAYNYGAPKPAVLSLAFDGLLADSAAVDLHSGLNALEIPYRVTGPGSHSLRALVHTADDAIPGNNYRSVPLMVGDNVRILLVTPRGRSPLPHLLTRDLADVTVRAQGELPNRAEDLLAFHCVVLEDFTPAGLPAGALQVLERYVKDFGGGLILAGGTRTYGDRRFKNTPLERLLPVTLEPRRPEPGDREPLALFVLIDRSNSMGYNSRIGTLRDGEKLRYAKEAALAVVRQLKNHDQVGVIAFDSQAWEISPLRPLEKNRTELQDLIPRLVENGGTDFYDALESARKQLLASRISRRHVILLTDGDTNRAAADHYPLIDDVAEAKISVTTIRIGDNAVNLRFLQDISSKTGGQFYHVQNVEMLPDLMLRDTTRALGPQKSDEERFFPELGQESQILKGINLQEVPPLSGYAYSRPRPGADVLFHVTRLDRRDPLLAIWNYGLGRVVAFTAAPFDDAERWLAWPGLGKYWSQLVRWAVREQRPGDYAIGIQKRDGATELMVRTFDPGLVDQVLLARLRVDEDEIREVYLSPVSPRLYRGRLPDLPAGRYALTVVRRREGADVDQRSEVVVIPEGEEEPQEEHARRDPNLALLRHLAEGTGGTLNAPARGLIAREPGERVATYSLQWLLLPLGMFLFLGDVAVRRILGSMREAAETAPDWEP